MGSVFRSTLSVVVAFVAASVVMMSVESVNGHYLYPELGKTAERMTDRDALRALLAGAPAEALLVVIFGWALGSLAGGFVAAWIARGTPVGHALILGGLLTLAGVVNNLMIPPPLWFWIAGLVILLPAAYAGARLAPRQAA